MSSPGMNPPTEPRSGRMGALRDRYGKAKVVKPDNRERRPWYKWKRRAK